MKDVHTMNQSQSASFGTVSYNRWLDHLVLSKLKVLLRSLRHAHTPSIAELLQHIEITSDPSTCISLSIRCKTNSGACLHRSKRCFANVWLIFWLCVFCNPLSARYALRRQAGCACLPRRPIFLNPNNLL